jgi:hypothetical protein
MATAMLQMLRAMNHWELAEACQAVGIPEGSRPEEIVRALSGAWWAAPWGAAEEERVLLLRAAEALNLMPRLRRHRHRLGLVERLVYGALIQQAFIAAPEEQQMAVLAAAEGYLEPAQALPASFASEGLSPGDRRHLSLQRLVSTGAGLRAVTSALTELRVEPAISRDRLGTNALFTALATAGPEAWGGRVVEWVRSRRGPELAALFHVLRLCWQRRQRLLTELRATVVALEEEEKRLQLRLLNLAAEKSAARRRLPWHLRPSTGAGIATGALAGTAAEIIATGGTHPAAPLALGVGCAWTLATLLRSGRSGADGSRPALLEAIRRARRQRAPLERQIAQLEE